MTEELATVATEEADQWVITRPGEANSKMTPRRVRTVLAGLGRAAFYLWLEKAEEQPDSAYAEFAELVELAHVRIIDKAARQGAMEGIRDGILVQVRRDDLTIPRD